MARRHLGFAVGEWEALPWWQRRLYVDGLNVEFAAADDRRAAPPAQAPPPRSPRASRPAPVLPDIADVADVLGVTVVRGG